MVATTSFFAILAATASLISATLNDGENLRDPAPMDQHKYEAGGKKGGYDNEGVEHQYGHANIPAHGDYRKEVVYSSYKPSYTYSSLPTTKTAKYTSIPIVRTSYYTPAPVVKSTVVAKASTASFKAYYPPAPSWSASSQSIYIASYTASSALSKRSSVSSSKFVDPFASSSKVGGFVAPAMTDATSSSTAAVTATISAGFSTLQAPRNSTTFRAPTAPISKSFLLQTGDFELVLTIVQVHLLNRRRTELERSWSCHLLR